jgi:hypothetical protein
VWSSRHETATRAAPLKRAGGLVLDRHDRNHVEVSSPDTGVSVEIDA